MWGRVRVGVPGLSGGHCWGVGWLIGVWIDELLVGWREKIEVVLGGIYLLRGVGLVLFVRGQCRGKALVWTADVKCRIGGRGSTGFVL